jgi:hypothetical protein
VAINPRRVTDRVIDRIRSSEYTLTVYYPLDAPKPTGALPISLPVAPLIKTPDPRPDSSDYAQRKQPEVSMRCLFTDVSVNSEYRQERVKAEISGWHRSTSALARVIASDASRPEGGTVFDGCDYVEIQGRRYKVLNVVLQSASTTPNGTYYVLLSGSSKS